MQTKKELGKAITDAVLRWACRTTAEARPSLSGKAEASATRRGKAKHMGPLVCGKIAGLHVPLHIEVIMTGAEAAVVEDGRVCGASGHEYASESEMHSNMFQKRCERAKESSPAHRCYSHQ